MVSYGALICVCTTNCQDYSHVQIPSPRAPAMVAVNKKSGKLVWEVNNVGERILHGQWSSPSVGKVGDVVQVVMGEGDGWVRGYEVLTGKKLWEFDLNPKDSVWPKTDRKSTRLNSSHDQISYAVFCLKKKKTT